jgi:hypothetical protein
LGDSAHGFNDVSAPACSRGYSVAVSLDLRNSSDGGANIDVIFCRFAATSLPQQRYFVIGFLYTMSGSGDCPQFVSMLNSAAQSLLAAKTISNEGLHFNCPFAAMFLAITVYTHMYFFRSHQISHDSQRCARVVFRLK